MFFRQNTKQKRKDKSSLPISLTGRMSLSASKKGSLTIEAACTVPLMMLVLVGMLSFGGAIRDSVRILAGVQETAKELAVLAYRKGEHVMAAEALTGIYAGSKIKQRAALDSGAGTIYLITQPLAEEQNVIDLAVRYKAPRIIEMVPYSAANLVIRGRVRAWTGREGSGTGENKETTKEKVLVTVNGKVYHRDPACSHIRLKIHITDKGRVKALRNSDGGKYRACELCGGDGEQLYVAETGDRYHSSLGCSGLKRSVVEVPILELENMQPCSRCGQ